MMHGCTHDHMAMGYCGALNGFLTAGGLAQELEGLPTGWDYHNGLISMDPFANNCHYTYSKRNWACTDPSNAYNKDQYIDVDYYREQYFG